jgi:hypothetical protein
MTNTFTTLAFNDTEVRAEKMAVVAFNNDIQEGRMTFYAYRENKFYNPMDDYKPLSTGQRLNETQKAEYQNLVDEAIVMFGREKARYTVSPQREDKPSDTGEMDKLKKLLAQKEEAEKALKAELEAMKAAAHNHIVRHYMFDKLLGLINKGQSVYLHGPAGTGKSKLAEDLAEAAGLEFYPASTVTQEFKLTGFEDGNGRYHETNFYKAVKGGGLFFLDEMDSCSSDVLVGLNGCLANRYFDFPAETIRAHKDFICIGAGNTIGRGADLMYTGRQALDLSTLDRFWGVPIGYDINIDKAVAKGDTELVDFIQEARKAAEAADIAVIFSYRSVGRLADFQDMFNIEELLEYAVFKGVAKDDINMLRRNMSLEASNKYFKGLKKLG